MKKAISKIMALWIILSAFLAPMLLFFLDIGFDSNGVTTLIFSLICIGSIMGALFLLCNHHMIAKAHEELFNILTNND